MVYLCKWVCVLWSCAGQMSLVDGRYKITNRYHVWARALPFREELLQFWELAIILSLVSVLSTIIKVPLLHLANLV